MNETDDDKKAPATVLASKGAPSTSKPMSTGAIIGIVIGALVIAGILIYLMQSADMFTTISLFSILGAMQ